MHAPPTPHSSRITPRELKRRLDEGRPVFMLDVRSPGEYQEWRIPNAVNLPLPRLLAGERPDAPRDAELVTVCLHGSRSEKARQALAQAGYRVSSLGGGMVGWNSVYDIASLTTPTAEIRQLRRVGKGCLGYLVASHGEAVAIDPTLDVDAYVEEARKMGAQIVAVLDTHAHADHVSGGRRLAEVSGGTYQAPEEVGAAASGNFLGQGSVVRLGNARLSVLETPGHTPGSVTFLIDDVAFTGDTLFIESVGRPDLGQDPRPNAKILWRTLHERLLSLPGSTRVLPGHFGETITLQPGALVSATLDELRTRLPALALEEAAFTEWVARNALPKPGNFETIKQYNRGAADADLEELAELEAGPNRCAVA